MSDLSLLASRFERFSHLECQDSPLYRQLALGIAQDPELLALVAHGDRGPKPNMIFASVQYLLLRGVQHRLAAYYPTLVADPLPPDGAMPHFRDFCLRHAVEIKGLMSTRRVQTNEVARSAFLRAAFGYISPHLNERPVAFVEVGTSAGLLLFWDRYACDYGDGGGIGIPDSPMRLRCELKGPGQPPITTRPPTVTSRIGLDLNPVDLRDPDALLWLRALVWADQPERAERLTRAAALAAQESLTLMKGDALDLLPSALAATPAGSVACVFHCHVLNQFKPDDRERFLRLLAEESRQREIWLLSLEGPNVMPMPGRAPTDEPDPELWVTHFAEGKIAMQQMVARFDGHGAWLRWLG